MENDEYTYQSYHSTRLPTEPLKIDSSRRPGVKLPDSARGLETVFAEDRLGGVTDDEIQKPLRRRAGSRGQGDGIDDWRMTILGKHVNQAHPLLRERVGPINDAERRLAARHESQRGAHILRPHDAA